MRPWTPIRGAYAQAPPRYYRTSHRGSAPLGTGAPVLGLRPAMAIPPPGLWDLLGVVVYRQPGNPHGRSRRGGSLLTWPPPSSWSRIQGGYTRTDIWPSLGVRIALCPRPPTASRGDLP